MPEIIIDAGEHDALREAITAQVEAGLKAPQPTPDTFADNLVPIVLFLAVALAYCVKYYFAYHARRDMQQTVRAALERGQPLGADLLEHLGEPARPRNRDLRRGVIGIGLGIGLAGAGLVSGEPDAVRPMLAVSLVPLLLGLAYLVLWKVGSNGR